MAVDVATAAVAVLVPLAALLRIELAARRERAARRRDHQALEDVARAAGANKRAGDGRDEGDVAAGLGGDTDGHARPQGLQGRRWRDG